MTAQAAAAIKTCPLCGDAAARRVADCRPQAIIFRCGHCGVDFAAYEPDDESRDRSEADHFDGLDRARYERSVRATREASYDLLVRRVAPHASAGRWLDVGCSYGWLLAYLRDRGFDPVGVEPSPGAAEEARRQRLEIYEGLFPDAVPEGVKFDVVSFMDVLEHLDDPLRVLRRTRDLLRSDGVLVIQVPDQSCLLYRLAESMSRWTGGRAGFALRRLWLVELDFPHRFYFTRNALERLFRRADYQVLDCYRSAIGSPMQALDRVAYMDSGKAISNMIVGTAVASINALDQATGHGGLLTIVARPLQSGPLDLDQAFITEQNDGQFNCKPPRGWR